MIKNKLLNADVLKASIQLKVPKTLPRAMEPFDVKCLLAVLDDVRNTAMILVLLRTGMRIGELLNTKVSDVHLVINRKASESHRQRQSPSKGFLGWATAPINCSDIQYRTP